jgi:biotin carboxylase
MRRILCLGAAHFQLPVIDYARRAGHWVLACDARRDSPGLRRAHEAHVLSTGDQAGVRQLAAARRVDGILAFGSDMAARTAAVVARELGLPGANVETIDLLTHKARFRRFLSSTGLQQQRHGSFRRHSFSAARALAGALTTAVIKPVDASGSRGVSVVDAGSDIGPALAYAFSATQVGEVIVEEFVARSGKQVCGDGYMDHGKLVFIELGDGHFHDRHGLLAPYAETFPSTHAATVLARLAEKVERILVAAGYDRGPFNLDAMVTRDGEPFVIEIGPRCGGNFIPTAIRCRTGVDLVAAAVEGCLDADFVPDVRRASDAVAVASYMLHDRAGGTFRSLHVDPGIRGQILEQTLFLEPGDEVPPFRTARDTVGNLILSFASAAQMSETIANFDAYCRLELQ